MANTAQVSMDGLMEINLNVREWDESIDDQTLSQIGQLLEDQSEIFDGISDLSLSQTQELYHFNLTPAPVDTDNVIDQLFPVKTEYKDERFGKFTDEDDIDNLVKSTESKNTRKNTSWSVKTFNEWRDARIASTGCTIPELINLTQPQEMNTWLSKFVVEAKRKDGQPYPPKSLYMLCVGLLRFMRECGIHENFLDEKDSKFYEFRRILSAKMSELTAQGIGTHTKQAEPVTTETEEELWNKGLLGNSSGKSLLNTMFYYNCKLFGLRGVDEHRQMEIDQVELGIDRQGHFVRFKGRVNKTYKGIFAEDNETATTDDVLSPVYYSPQFEEVLGKVKGSAALPCRVDPQHLSKPRYMSVTWKREDLFLVSVSQDAQGALKLSYVDQTIEDTKKFTVTDSYGLVVSDLVIGDTDNYTCTVILFSDTDKTDLKERYSNSTELLVQDIPSIPGRPTISDVKSREATVSWEHSLKDNNSPITAYIIRVRSQSENTEETYMSINDTPSTIISSLLPYHSYKVTITAVNGVGRSRESQESETFWTESEAPEAPPTIISAYSRNSTQITLLWKPPPANKINGILKSYDIQYGIVNGDYKQSYTEENKDKTNLTIPNLKPFTEYFVSVRAENNVGLGPDATVTVRTAEGKPSKPRIIHASNQKSTSLFVSWEAPKELRGNLIQYEIQLKKHNGTVRVKIVNGSFHSTNKAYISGLEPYTQYEIKVRAVTGGGKGEFSTMYPALTDVSTPGVPEILNVTVIGPDAVYVQWKCPSTFYRDVDAYKVVLKDTKSYFTEEVIHSPKFKKCFGGIDSKFETNVTKLPSNRVYTIEIAAITKSIIDGQGQHLYQGEFSKIQTFRLRGSKIENENKTDPAAIEEAEEELMSAGIVAGIVCCLLFILLAAMVFIGCRSLTCRKYYRAAYNYLAVPTNNHSPTNIVIAVPEPAEEITYPSIPVGDFLQHCKSLHADSDVGFSQEFADINKLSCSWNIRADSSNQHENKAKNRYINITAFDHTRVLLRPINGRMRSADYINANYVDGYKKKQAYIATQGPLPQTFPDFWRMVWEQNSVVIVMITKLVERGRRKCDQYWPDDGIEQYGPIQVKHLNTFSRAHYTVRMFSLKNTKIKKQYSERIVYHFHYTEWPDHGVPDFTLPVLKFVQKSAYINPPGAGPIVVHCSAGVGRTGTYILIDSMIEQIKDKGNIDVAGFLLRIRRQRKFLVQTEEQYMLIHDALAEYILSHDTEIKHGDLCAYIEKITQVHDGERDTPLERQYKLVTNFTPSEADKLCACLNINQSKNRSNELVPLNVKRVPLPTKPGIEGSDYINATYLQGYNKTDEFILTQHPLEETVEDFWRMVWDQNSSVIFLMTPAEDPEYKKFWPDKDNPIAVDTGHFKLALREEEELAHYKQLEFLLESTQDDYILMTRIIICPEWPQKDVPLYKAFDMIETVKDLHRQNDIGPVIVIDRFGGVEGGVFCALWSLHDQQIHDKVVDVYHLCKLFHLKRPGMLGTQEDYLLLYKAMESYIQDQSERETNNLSHHLHLRTASKKNGTMPRSPTLSVKVETNV